MRTLHSKFAGSISPWPGRLSGLFPYAVFSTANGVRDEKDVPAQRHSTQAHAWLSRTHGHEERAQGACSASRQGARAPYALRWSARRRAGAVAFPRSVRLTEAAEFGRVFAGAERFADRFFTVLVLKNDGPGARLGMAVSRRVAPRSVCRSRLKRLVREHFRHTREALGAVDCVVLAKPPARTAPNATLHRSLERLWQRIAQSCAAASSR